jgi:p-hydroxybenzoate 3-monooxygenase
MIEKYNSWTPLSILARVSLIDSSAQPGRERIEVPRRTQVAIIGAGPSGLILSQLLSRQGIDSVVIEHRSRSRVEARIRAGLLEWGTVELLNEAGVGERMMRQGLVHDGFALAFKDRVHRIDLKGLAGRSVLVYGQTELQRDLGESAAARVIWEAEHVAPVGFDSSSPRVRYTAGGTQYELECDFIVGCDGYHGVCRASIPHDRIVQHERVYPFGWLGIMADVPPLDHELIYAHSEKGFALCSMRSASRSRYYIQCALDERLEDWPDDRFWEELQARLPPEYADRLRTGPSTEKSIAPLRSFVVEPMQYGRLFLAGDAAHIVPPTGAKGLNLAAADVRVLHQGLVDYYRSRRETLLDEYSSRALRRVWKATRFSWWFTNLMHKLSMETFDGKLQQAELDYLSQSEAASRSVAESYVGLYT